MTDRLVIYCRRHSDKIKRDQVPEPKNMALVQRSRMKKAVAALAISACVVASVFDGFTLLLFSSSDDEQDGGDAGSHRGLLASPRRNGRDVHNIIDEEDLDIHGMVEDDSSPVMHTWAKNNLVLNHWTPEVVPNGPVLFWHIPKSGGTTAKAIYRCFGKNYEVLSQARPILDAKKNGLIASGFVDMIFSSYPQLAARHLLDPQHKGTAFVMLRHPVDRLISKFYYLQVATWEKTYRPDWKDMDILEWARTQNGDNNILIKKLAGYTQTHKPMAVELELAKTTLRERFIIGRMDQFEESIHRLNTIMGIDENEKRTSHCMDRFFSKDDGKTNSNPHPRVKRGSPAWKLLAEQNALDIELYEYAVKLFDEQETMFFHSPYSIKKRRLQKRLHRQHMWKIKKQDDSRKANTDEEVIKSV